MTPEMIKYCEDFAARNNADIEYIKFSMEEAIHRRSPMILDSIGISIKGFSSMTIQEAHDAVDKYCKFDIKPKI